MFKERRMITDGNGSGDSHQVVKAEMPGSGKRAADGRGDGRRLISAGRGPKEPFVEGEIIGDAQSPDNPGRGRREGHGDARYRGTPDCLNSFNQGIFSRMSDRAKKIAVAFYEGVYKMPGTSWIAGKMEIAYNQFWANRHENKSVKHKETADGFGLQIKALDRSKEQIQSVIARLESQGMPGADSLRLQLRDIDRQKEKYLAKQDKAQSKFEARDNKKKNYVNERDKIADRLIGRYDEKLKPLNEQMEALHQKRDRVDVLLAVTKARQQREWDHLAEMEREKKEIMDALTHVSKSERRVLNHPAVKILEKQIAAGRARLLEEQKVLQREKEAINKKVAKLDDKANPFRDKREVFVRVRNRRPVDIKMAARLRANPTEAEERPEAHPRGEVPAEEGSAAPRAEVFRAPEAKEEEGYFHVGDFIAGWNDLLRDRLGDDAEKALVDEKDFLAETGLFVDENLRFDDLRDILENYHQLKKNLPDGFDSKMDELKEKIS